MDIIEAFPENPLEPTVKYAGISAAPIFVPWARGRVPLGTGFDSRREPTDALFKDTMAFVDSTRLPLHFRQCQTTSIIDDSSSDIANSSSSTNFAIGASVGGSFLGASGRGSYEKNVRDNKNKSNIGVRAEHTCGQIDMIDIPRLNKHAINLLARSKKPVDDFHQAFGDFYVAGYRVGAVCNTAVSGELANKSLFEAKRVELKVKVVFATRNKSINETNQSGSDVGGLTVSAFDSLTTFYSDFVARSYDDSIRAAELASENRQRALSIATRATKVLSTEFSLVQDGPVYQDTVDRLCDRGLVTELFLAPFAMLREYQSALAFSLA